MYSSICWKVYIICYIKLHIMELHCKGETNKYYWWPFNVLVGLQVISHLWSHVIFQDIYYLMLYSKTFMISCYIPIHCTMYVLTILSHTAGLITCKPTNTWNGHQLKPISQIIFIVFTLASVIPLYVVLNNILCILFSKWRNTIITHISYYLTFVVISVCQPVRSPHS